MKKQIKKLTSIMFAISLILCIIGCKKEPEFNILDYVYTVSFESNGGEEIDSQTVVLGETVENPGEPEYKEKPETKIFAGWYTDKELKEEYDFSAKVENSFTLYAKWMHECKGLGEWEKNDDGHYKLCDCGEKKDFEEHTYDIWKVVQKPTDTQAGRNERTCKDCAYIDSVVLQPAPEGFVSVKGATVTGALPAWLDESASDYYKGVFIEGRTVTLSDFYMGKYEVTQEEYASVMAGQKVTVGETEYALESNPSYCTKDNYYNCALFSGDVQEKRSVEEVTWYDAVWYCNALSEKEGLTKAYNIEVTRVEQARRKTGYHIYSANVTLNKNATGYRLPTEAEWEYAARGGDPTAADWNYVFSGADTAAGVSYESYKNAGLDSVGWYCYNNRTGISGDYSETGHATGKGTHQVGKKAPNRLGLYDMSGNVLEWCYDWYGTVDNETPVDGTASGSYRVYRGGSWDDYAKQASVCYRYIDYSIAIAFYRNLGFRVVRQAN